MDRVTSTNHLGDTVTAVSSLIFSVISFCPIKFFVYSFCFSSQLCFLSVFLCFLCFQGFTVSLILSLMFLIFNFFMQNVAVDAMDKPFLNAYLDSVGLPSFRRGCNFAAAGSTILPATPTSVSPFSFGRQVAQFLRFKARVLELLSQSMYTDHLI
jgi:hypothetical protein